MPRGRPRSRITSKVRSSTRSTRLDAEVGDGDGSSHESDSGDTEPTPAKVAKTNRLDLTNHKNWAIHRLVQELECLGVIAPANLGRKTLEKLYEANRKAPNSDIRLTHARPTSTAAAGASNPRSSVGNDAAAPSALAAAIREAQPEVNSLVSEARFSYANQTSNMAAPSELQTLTAQMSAVQAAIARISDMVVPSTIGTTTIASPCVARINTTADDFRGRTLAQVLGQTAGTPETSVRKSFGVPMSTLPRRQNLSPSLRQAIIMGKDI
jgi:hypothetical protein